MLRGLNLIIITCFALDGFGQRFISEINLGNSNDSIWVIEEYYPKQVSTPIIGDEIYDFSFVGASCGKLMQISANDSVLQGSYEQKEIYKFNVSKSGLKELIPIDLIEKFEQFEILLIEPRKVQPLLSFPLKEGTKESVGSWQIHLKPKRTSTFSKYDSIRVDISAVQNVEIATSQEVLFPFGKRIAVPVKIASSYTINEATGYKDGSPEEAKNGSSMLTAAVSIRELIFNTYRGALLADVSYQSHRIKRVRILEESRANSKYRKCNVTDAAFQLYPNPNYGQMNIYLSNPQLGKYRLSVMNVIGKELYALTLDHQNTISNFNVEFPNIHKGTYLYSIIDPSGNRLYTRRLMIIGL